MCIEDSLDAQDEKMIKFNSLLYTPEGKAKEALPLNKSCVADNKVVLRL